MTILIQLHQALFRLQFPSRLRAFDLSPGRRLLFASGIVAIGLFINCFSSANNGFPNIKVQFVNPSTGWIIGPRLWRTTDGGKTWSIMRENGDGTFRAKVLSVERQRVQFINPEVGWVLGGRDTIVRTNDGGRTWSDVLKLPIDRDFPLQSFFFISPEQGWAVGEYLYYTNDAGRTWQRLSKLPKGDLQRQDRLRISSESANYNPIIWFTDTKRGLMARLDGEVYATNDGGVTWKMAWQVDAYIYDLFFVDNQNGWLVGEEGFMARTVDGGITWTTTQIPAKVLLLSVFFINRQVGWAVGSNNTILYTRDGGVTWKAASVDGLKGSSALASVSFSDELHGFAVGGNGNASFSSSSSPSNVVLATDDGGMTWHTIQF